MCLTIPRRDSEHSVSVQGYPPLIRGLNGLAVLVPSTTLHHTKSNIVLEMPCTENSVRHSF